MSALNAESAINQTYVAITPQVPTRYANVAFTPPEAGVWVEAFFSANPAAAHTNFSDGINEITGIAQFDVYGPEGKGEGAHDTVIRRLENAFRVGSVHAYNDQETTVMRAGAINGYLSGSYWKKIFTITFRSYAFRNPSI